MLILCLSNKIFSHQFAFLHSTVLKYHSFVIYLLQTESYTLQRWLLGPWASCQNFKTYFKIRTDWSKWIDNEYLLISSQFWIKLYIYLLQITVKWWKPASVVYDLNRLYIYLLQIAVQWGGLAHTPVSLPGLRQTVLVWWLLFWAVCSGYNLLLTEDPVPHRFSCRFAREDRCTHSLVFVLPPMPA